MIAVENLSVRLSHKRVIEDVAFSAKAARFTAICGPNGSGKTTTLKAISGEIDYQGSIRLNGNEVADMKPQRLAAMRGVLPQASILGFPFTVSEVARMGLEAGLPVERQLADAHIAEALATVDLRGFEGRFYQELSGGEQQRCQLARVLCQIRQPTFDGNPNWLLLDEPVSSLDIRHQIHIMEIARKFCDAGGGVIAVMHDLNLTALFADDIVMMKSGRVHTKGPAITVLTDETLESVFDCRLRVNTVPEAGARYVLPHSAIAP